MILFSFCLFDFLSISTTYGHRSGLKRRPVNWELCLTAQLSLKHNGLGQYPHHCSHCTSSSVHLPFSFPLLNKTLIYLNSSTWRRDCSQTRSGPSTISWLRMMMYRRWFSSQLLHKPNSSVSWRLFQNLTKRIETAFYSHILLSVHTMKCFLYACCLISFQGKYVYHTGSPGGRFWRLIDCTLSKPQLNPTMWPRVC